ncbi:MAG: hypothetical protein K6G42_06415 [Lachnospiraceae bacterium]|nr:hypothetical protein [Lachnospiraceae bacterium]
MQLENKTQTEKKLCKLDDDMLTQVSGGYWETAGYSSGYYVKCPICGEERESMFNTWVENDTTKLDGFKCLNCGELFGVDVHGIVWD